MRISVELPILAKCIQESDDSIYCLKHDLTVGELYKVESISMGQSSTSVMINGKIYNSAYLEFYSNGVEINSYESSLFNPYMKVTPTNLIKVLR